MEMRETEFVHGFKQCKTLADRVIVLFCFFRRNCSSSSSCCVVFVVVLFVFLQKWDPDDFVVYYSF